ncbi:MAG TPA: hypothetical protein VFQ76_08905 [Longimicrobiaceae bacterium]|nr:hypothetical protein [Longimicrobiaceae bacterium]
MSPAAEAAGTLQPPQPLLAPPLHVTPEQVPAPAPTSKARGRKARTAK